MYDVYCRAPGCTYRERFHSMQDASNMGQYHALRSGHRDVVMEAVEQ